MPSPGAEDGASGEGVVPPVSPNKQAAAGRELQEILAAGESVLARVKVLSGRAAQLEATARSLEQDLGFVKEELTKLQRSVKTATTVAGPEHAAVAVAVERVLYSAHAVLMGSGPGGDLRGLMKAPAQGPFMNLMLGRATRVLQSRPEARMQLKECYYSFRDATSPWHVVLPLVLLALRRAPTRDDALPLHLRAHLPPGTASLLLPLCSQLYWSWLLVFNTALALREHTLRVNGSGIRNWWIRHHYLSVALILAIMTWPCGSAVWDAFTKRYWLWAAAQGCVFMLQNQYQRKRTYTRIALGRASSMEVASGEAAATSGQLRALFPALFAMQLIQAHTGVVCLLAGLRGLRAALSPDGGAAARARGDVLIATPLEWQAGVVGCLLLVQGAGNFIGTWRSIADKRRAGRREQVAAAKQLVAQAHGHKE